jgi:hypothetical protein
MGQLSWIYQRSSTDVRALLRLAARRRRAASWYGGRFTAHLNLLDGFVHQLALYVVDWDSCGSGEIIELLDASNGTVLDTQTVTEFAGGQYWIWNVQGDVTIRITCMSGPDALFSALFFNPVNGTGTVASQVAGAAPAGLSRSPGQLKLIRGLRPRLSSLTPTPRRRETGRGCMAKTGTSCSMTQPVCPGMRRHGCRRI